MNKEQQSLDELRDLVHSELDGTKMLYEYLKHCDTLQKLVDKATPKKVSNTEFYHIDVNIKRTKCPQCSMYIYGIINISVINFCNHCGQALDWSDEDDK